MTFPLVHVVEARCLGDFRVWLRFDDGTAGEIDLGDELYGPIFEPLREPEYFAGFRVDLTLCWANGADFAPEFLWERVREANRAA